VADRPIWNPTEHGVLVLLPVLGLAAVGLASIHATETRTGSLLGPNTTKQCVFLLIGAGVMVATLWVSYQRIGRMAYSLFALTLALLSLLLVDKWFLDLPLIENRQGAWRWIDFGGIQIQPSELMKVVFILALARYLQFRRNYRRLSGLMGPFVLTLVPMFLILPEPDLGTVVLMMPVLLVMLFAAGARYRHFMLMLLLAICALPLVWAGMHGYQRRRVAAVVMQSPAVRDKVMGLVAKLGPQPELENELTGGALSEKSRRKLAAASIAVSANATVQVEAPGRRWTLTDSEQTWTIRRVTRTIDEQKVSHFHVYQAPSRPWTWLGTPQQARDWELTDGYQLKHAMVALSSGGWFGQRDETSLAILQSEYIPHRHNDFIFAVVGYRWGFVGALFVIGCYAVIAVGGVEIASLTNEPFGRLLAVGVVTLISAQALINIGISLGLMPTTGMTLPFVSYGGSSLLVNFIAVGLLINIAQRRPMVIGHEPFSFTDDDEE
jgi:rod shape determining protein RodA